MTSLEQVTDFNYEGATVRQLFQAINDYLTKCGIEPEDRGFGTSFDEDMLVGRSEFRWMIAFAIEGESEGYYIHIGGLNRTLNSRSSNSRSRDYYDFGHAKCYSADQAYQIAREAQRFLTSADWN